MKKILLSILFILIFTTINAQSPKKYDIAFPSWYTYQEVGDSLAPMVWIMNTTIPVSLDSILIYQTNRNQLETNANLIVGGSDVANGNPVPVSDAGGSLTVDNAGTFTVQTSSTVHPAGMSTADSTATLSVTGTATALPTIACKRVRITHVTGGETIYLISSSGGTAANGFPINPYDIITVNPASAEQWHLISDGTTVDARLIIEN